MDRIQEWIVPAILLPVAGVITLWMTGAIYFDACRGTRRGRVIALAWIVFVCVLFAVWQPLWQPFAVLLAVFAVFLGWWLSQKPSHDLE